MATDRRSGGIERVLAKCQSCVEAGNYYEAHQMYRTLYFRHGYSLFTVCVLFHLVCEMPT